MRIAFAASFVFLLMFEVCAQEPCMSFQDLNGGIGTVPRAMAMDADGAIYLTGAFTDSVNFGEQVIHGAGHHVFVAKFDPANELAWSSVFANNLFSVGTAIALDGTGGLVITGDYMDALSFGTCTADHPGGTDIFLAKLNTVDGSCQWLTTGNCIGDAYAQALTIAADGTIRIAGGFHGYCTFGSTTLTCTGTSSPFVSAYSADGAALWAKQVLDPVGGESEGVTTDLSGNTYMVGSHGSTGNFGNGITLSPGGYFVAKYNAAGVAQWARQGIGTGSYRAVACDASGELVVQYNNPTGVVKYSATGDTLWNRTWGGNGATAFGMSDDHAWSASWYTTVQAVGSDTIMAMSNTNKVALVEFDGLGALVGLYGFDNEGMSGETPTTLCFDAFGKPVVGGGYTCTTANVPDTVLGLPDLGGMAPFIMRACNTSGIGQTQLPVLQLRVFPDPASTSIIVEYELLRDNDHGQFYLFGPQGRLVKRATLHGHNGRLELDIHSLEPGSYIGRIETNAGSFGMQRLVVVR